MMWEMLELSVGVEPGREKNRFCFMINESSGHQSVAFSEIFGHWNITAYFWGTRTKRWPQRGGWFQHRNVGDRRPIMHTGWVPWIKSEISCGVPHSCVLGPFVFMLHIFPLGGLLKNVSYHFYTDLTIELVFAWQYPALLFFSWIWEM